MDIYVEKNYCVYITHYHGNLLPQNYIGSSTIQRIENGYHGSVRSKKYKLLWEQEIKQNPYLFETFIISTHYTRQEAIYKELKLQKIFNVVTNKSFINQSYAAPNGYFGSDVSGKNNPNYGNSYKQSKETLKKHKEYHKTNPRIWLTSKEGISKHIKISESEKYLNSGWVKKRIFTRTKKSNKKTPKCCCYICKQELCSNNINRHYKHKHST